MSRIQGNKYDKIVKENIASLLPVIIKNMLDLDISDTEEIAGEVQYTKERKPDVLKKVTDQNNNTFVLHLEWQTHNEKDMVYRMAEYAVMLQRKYRMPVKQYVIFIGKGRVTMSTNIDLENFKFWYRILSLKDFDYKFFLKSDDPATKVFAILANFERDGEDKAIADILHEVKTSTDGKFQLSHFYNQLEVLAKLRNDNINLKLNDMILRDVLLANENFIRKLESEYLYQIGKVEGVTKGKAEGKVEGKAEGKAEGKVEIQKQIVEKMRELGLAAELITMVTNIPVEEVKKM